MTWHFHLTTIEVTPDSWHVQLTAQWDKAEPVGYGSLILPVGAAQMLGSMLLLAPDRCRGLATVTTEHRRLETPAEPCS